MSEIEETVKNLLEWRRTRKDGEKVTHLTDEEITILKDYINQLKSGLVESQKIRIQADGPLGRDHKVTLHPSGVDISEFSRDIKITMNLEEVVRAEVEYIIPEIDVVAHAKFFKYIPPEIKKALQVIFEFGSIDGAHHKQWVLDQVVRALTGDGYEGWVKEAKDGEEGPDSYSWDEGIAP